jgi:hypothetical protein
VSTPSCQPTPDCHASSVPDSASTISLLGLSLLGLRTLSRRFRGA